MMLNCASQESRSVTFCATFLTEKGISGMRITSAPPETPEWSAIQPAWRPITSRIITRSCDSAVECRRSSASVAMSSAVMKPKVNSGAGEAASVELVRDGELALAADGDDGVYPEPREVVNRLAVDVVRHRVRAVLL